MKLMRNHKMYVGKDDILFLEKNINIPKCIWDKILKDSSLETNNEEFFVFTNPEVIVFFQNEQNIFDIDNLNNMSIDQINDRIDEYKLELNNLNDKWLNCNHQLIKSVEKEEEIVKYKIETLKNYQELRNENIKIYSKNKGE